MDTEIEDEAIQFARKYKKEISKKITNLEIYLPDHNPSSVFMAGSPGVGKTEASIELLTELEKSQKNKKVLRIDPDELRSEFDGYAGNNASLFNQLSRF